MGLVYEPGALGFVRTLPPTTKKRVRAALEVPSKDPRDGRPDRRALATDGMADGYRAKVGDYRIAAPARHRSDVRAGHLGRGKSAPRHTSRTSRFRTW